MVKKAYNILLFLFSFSFLFLHQIHYSTLRRKNSPHVWPNHQVSQGVYAEIQRRRRGKIWKTQWNSGLTNWNRAVVKSLSKKTIIKVITTNHNGRKHRNAPLIQNFYQLTLTCSMLPITLNLLKARKKSRVQGRIGFGFASRWYKTCATFLANRKA